MWQVTCDTWHIIREDPYDLRGYILTRTTKKRSNLEEEKQFWNQHDESNNTTGGSIWKNYVLKTKHLPSNTEEFNINTPYLGMIYCLSQGETDNNLSEYFQEF